MQLQKFATGKHRKTYRWFIVVIIGVVVAVVVVAAAAIKAIVVNRSQSLRLLAN